MESFKTLLETYFSHCKYEKNLSPLTLKAYQLDLNQFLRFVDSELKPETINKDIIKNYLRHLYELRLKESSIRRKMISLKAFFSFLEYEDKIVVSPFRKLKLSIKIPQRLPQVMNINEIKTLLTLSKRGLWKIKNNGTKDTSKPFSRRECSLVQHALIFEILFATGMRVSELSKIKLEGIDLARRVIKVDGKGSKERVIPIPNDEILELLRFFIDNRSSVTNSSNFLLVNRLNRRMKSQSIRTIVQKYVKQAGIEKRVTPHTFRHTTATMLLENGTDIRIVQQLLGHSSITMTQKYTHVSETAQRKIITLNHPRNFM